ncbi:MAG TPA: MFS transporter, partial [Anaerolineae bacterium]|nr:MFS transporter [Anaerolineae bacterium]
LLFPLSVLGFSVSRSLAFSALCLALNGMGFVAQNATINTMIQGAVPDDLRGRVMAVYILLFFGSTPFASLMAGTLGQMLGVRAAVAIGAAITLGSACYALWRSPALRRAQVA